MVFKVAVEGLPGSGKTTLIRTMMPELNSLGFTTAMVDVETVGYAPAIRAIARPFPTGHPVRSLFFWILYLLEDERVTKEKADIVFLDRSWSSQVAFDVYGNGIPREILEWVGSRIQNQPDITLFLEAPVKTVWQRRKSKSMSDPAFAERVARGYHELADILKWIRIDTTQETLQVKEQCIRAVLQKLKNL